MLVYSEWIHVNIQMIMYSHEDDNGPFLRQYLYGAGVDSRLGGAGTLQNLSVGFNISVSDCQRGELDIREHLDDVLEQLQTHSTRP